MMGRTRRIVVIGIAVALASLGAFYGILVYRQDLPPPGHLLVVRATDVVVSDAPEGVGIPADFGPHCAPARFVPWAGLVIEIASFPRDAIGVVLIEYEPMTPFLTVGEGVGLAFILPDDGAPIRSAVNESVLLFSIRAAGASALVDGKLIRPGAVERATYATPVSIDGDLWTVTESYALLNLGWIPVSVRPPPLCA